MLELELGVINLYQPTRQGTRTKYQNGCPTSLRTLPVLDGASILHRFTCSLQAIAFWSDRFSGTRGNPRRTV